MRERPEPDLCCFLFSGGSVGRGSRSGRGARLWWLSAAVRMGQGLSFDLTQDEIEDLERGCSWKFSQTDIQNLYKRFLKLDKDKKGFISPEELLAIPEFSLNPLAQRLVSIFENVNFKDFLNLLSAFSPKATKEEKLKFMFNFHDVDGDGYISRLDLEHVTRQVRESRGPERRGEKRAVAIFFLSSE